MKLLDLEWRSPLAAFAPLAHEGGAVLLHGGAASIGADWSMIAASPSRRIESVKGVTRIDGQISSLSPFEALAREHERRRAEGDCLSPLASGLIGFAGYEAGRFVEPTAAGPGAPYDVPDFSFGAYDAVASFNRQTRRAVVAGRTSADAERLAARLGVDDAGPLGNGTMFDAPHSNFTRDRYCAVVARVIDRIRRGEIFQANISQRFVMTALNSFDPYRLFCAASVESSGAFGAFLPVGEAAIISLSPERFFAVERREDGRFAIIAEPIKGTRPRGATPEDDARLLAELVADPKDRAENIMIADLTRNDLSRICDDFSIREAAICAPQSHATVHHLVSRVGGVLRKELSAAEALAALFPCGSITGAPKVQSMKVIADIEGMGRGPYCGAIGYIDDRGGADFSVAIRMAIADRGGVSVPVGGGVTLRSDPQAEYEETLAKAQQFFRLLGLKVPQGS